MQTFPSEKILMISDDNSVTLTTHRIFQRKADTNKDLLLKHIITHQVIKRRKLYYKLLTVFFLIMTFIAYQNLDPRYDEKVFVMVLILVGLSVISACFLFVVQNRYLKIVSCFGEIEFSLSKMDQSSLNKFLNKMYDEIEKRKKEE
ncbi:hypothetical protein [Flavobacterium microcysteis]|uniref:Uncharacterized protein n=1 Tax=Flavobacterium microcysteis TaxID=2596891 RepID=A0A501Q7M1_9FLAO|nr:hypothetical protein [Flavobacterium microcysteis]TPD68217.1 hypothetical protein FJA49_09110 [Flavobacterium microcysteis]